MALRSQELWSSRPRSLLSSCRRKWSWPLWASVLFIAGFLSVDLAFLAANLMKVVEGGWVPLVLGACSMVVMWTWVRGSHLLTEKTHRDSIPIKDLIPMLQKSKPIRVPGLAIFLTADPELAPVALMHNHQAQQGSA